MAEWLRRWTRNPMGYPRAGSNPAHSVPFWSHFLLTGRRYSDRRFIKFDTVLW